MKLAATSLPTCRSSIRSDRRDLLKAAGFAGCFNVLSEYRVNRFAIGLHCRCLVCWQVGSAIRQRVFVVVYPLTHCNVGGWYLF